jgi:hypothetical protein
MQKELLGIPAQWNKLPQIFKNNDMLVAVSAV